MTPRCRVYAKWETPLVKYAQDVWSLSPCWTDPSINLVSFHMYEVGSRLAKGGQLYAILERHDRLESVRLDLIRVGSVDAPLTFPAAYLQGLRAPLTIEIITSNGCWLHLDDMTPFSGKLVLNTKGPLHVGIPTARGSMVWHHLEGASASSVGEGPDSLWRQLTDAIEEHNQALEDKAAAHCFSCIPFRAKRKAH